MTVKNERAEAIRGIQAQMAEYGLTMEALAAAGCFDPPPPPHASAAPSATGLLLPRGKAGTGRARCPIGCGGNQCRAECGIFPDPIASTANWLGAVVL